MFGAPDSTPVTVAKGARLPALLAYTRFNVLSSWEELGRSQPT